MNIVSAKENIAIDTWGGEGSVNNSHVTDRRYGQKQG
jgi:hypothetical protein